MCFECSVDSEPPPKFLRELSLAEEQKATNHYPVSRIHPQKSIQMKSGIEEGMEQNPVDEEQNPSNISQEVMFGNLSLCSAARGLPSL